MANEIQVTWFDGRTDTLAVDEVIFADRTCGQSENGWLCYRADSEREEYFISDSGVVYIDELSVGIAPEIKATADRIDEWGAA